MVARLYCLQQRRVGHAKRLDVVLGVRERDGATRRVNAHHSPNALDLTILRCSSRWLLGRCRVGSSKMDYGSVKLLHGDMIAGLKQIDGLHVGRDGQR